MLYFASWKVTLICAVCALGVLLSLPNLFSPSFLAKMPNWLPAYPGSTPEGSVSMQNATGTSGSFHFTTKDSVEQVMSYYEDALKKTGLKINTNTVQQNGKTSLGTLTGEEAGNKRKAYVTASPTTDGTNVGLTFTTQ